MPQIALMNAPLGAAPVGTDLLSGACFSRAAGESPKSAARAFLPANLHHEEGKKERKSDGTPACAEQLAEKVDAVLDFGWRSGLPLR